MIRRIGVVIPACNEEQSILGCLQAVDAARLHLQQTTGRRIDVRVVVVLDGCTDGTGAIARSQPGVETLASTARSVGVARRVGADHLLRTTAGPHDELWLANTDADSFVPIDWLTVAVTEADHGNHVMLGTVLPDWAPSVLDLAWRSRHDTGRQHPHVHGANFGLRADSYVALGGWPALACHEDVMLAQRAAAVPGIRICRTGRIPVRTSVRAVGRAPGGFSKYIRDLTAELADR